MVRIFIIFLGEFTGCVIWGHTVTCFVNRDASQVVYSFVKGKPCYNPFCNKNPFCNNLLQNGLGEHYYNSGRQLQPVL